MIARIGKTYSFDAAHQLPGHDGKCARHHGHTYTMRIELEGEIVTDKDRPDDGMVCDYGRLDEAWAKLLEPLLDHRDLNNTLGNDDRRCWPTTAENIAGWALTKLRRLTDLPVVAVSVSETPKTFARVEAP